VDYAITAKSLDSSTDRSPCRIADRQVQPTIISLQEKRVREPKKKSKELPSWKGDPGVFLL
jgi:hypothetical protein